MEGMVPEKWGSGSPIPIWRWTQDVEDILSMRVLEAGVLTTSRETFGQAVKRATFHKIPAM